MRKILLLIFFTNLSLRSFISLFYYLLYILKISLIAPKTKFSSIKKKTRSSRLSSKGTQQKSRAGQEKEILWMNMSSLLSFDIFMDNRKLLYFFENDKNKKVLSRIPPQKNFYDAYQQKRLSFISPFDKRTKQETQRGRESTIDWLFVLQFCLDFCNYYYIVEFSRVALVPYFPRRKTTLSLSPLDHFGFWIHTKDCVQRMELIYIWIQNFFF